MEQLNIEGKRSGEGFVCHKGLLVTALGKAQSLMVEMLDLIIGRKGLLNYLRLLGGSQIVKIVPQDGNQSLKVVCGANTSTIVDGAWLTEKTRVGSACQVRVSPHNAIMPNVGGAELAEALARVIPFTARGKDAESRPILACIRFQQKEGKLTLTATDAFRASEVVLPLEDGEGQACIDARDIKAIVASLRKAKRVRLVLNGNLDIMTEEISYRWAGVSGRYPDLPIPESWIASARLDSAELIKASASINALSSVGEVLLTIAEGKVLVEDKEGIGNTEITAETAGEAQRLLDARWLLQALKACGAMVEVEIAEQVTAPVRLSVNGHTQLIMPKQKPVKAEAVVEAEAVAKQTEGKTKRKRKGKAVEVEAEAEAVEAEAVEVTA